MSDWPQGMMRPSTGTIGDKRGALEQLQEANGRLVAELARRGSTDNRAGEFRLIHEPAFEHVHRGHQLTERRYPDLDPAATFVDCWTCSLTWEIGR